MRIDAFALGKRFERVVFVDDFGFKHGLETPVAEFLIGLFVKNPIGKLDAFFGHLVACGKIPLALVFKALALFAHDDERRFGHRQSHGLALVRPDKEHVHAAEVKGDNLTVFIETESGVDLDTCEKFHNAIMEPIDELDPSYGAAYTLNVSSPGLDRPFKTARDFERNLGKEVEVKLFAPLKGKKFLEGVLSAFDNNSVTITIGGAEEKIAKNKIAKINKAIKFD